jgi:hypothetical protein
MPYCNTALKIERPEEVTKILSTFAREQCKARSAYPLTSGQFNIDGGENDLRAVRQNEPDIVGFFCRYEHDLGKTKTKIQAFANNHPLECKTVNFKQSDKIVCEVENGA